MQDCWGQQLETTGWVTAPGHAAAPPMRVMKSRHLIQNCRLSEAYQSAPCASQQISRTNDLGQERTSPACLATSALPPKADIDRRDWHVCFVPKADSCSAAKQLRLRKLPTHLRSSLAGVALAAAWELAVEAREDPGVRRNGELGTRVNARGITCRARQWMKRSKTHQGRSRPLLFAVPSQKCYGAI